MSNKREHEIIEFHSKQNEDIIFWNQDIEKIQLSKAELSREIITLVEKLKELLKPYDNE